jgi:CelD/BcsL family acetyltransferase involved in cellulose biosynthesis
MKTIIADSLLVSPVNTREGDRFLRVDCITEEARFYAMKTEWNLLLAQSRQDEVTLTWEWLYTWWQTFRTPSHTLMILTARNREDQLVGIAPLYIRTVKPYPLLPPIRQVAFLASGEAEADAICSDYLHFIVMAGEAEQGILRALVHHVWSDKIARWDEIQWVNMKGDAKMTAYLEQVIADSGRSYRRELSEQCAYITLPDSWEGFVKTRSGNLRANLRSHQKALESEGLVDTVSAVDPATLEANLSILIDLHQRLWVEKGKPGVFSSGKFLAFHRALLPLALQRGWLCLIVLRLNGTPIAALYNFKYNNKVYYYQSGTNSHLKGRSKRIAPGLLLHGYCIRAAISEGLREYDFLAGGAARKGRWTKTFRPMVTINVAGRTGAIRCVNVVRRMITLLRKVKHSLRPSVTLAHNG